MEVTTSCGTLFVIPSVEKKKFKEISPCEFLAMLLTENRGLSWATFNRENIAEIIDGAVKGLPDLARKLSPPFDFDNRIFQVSKDWKHIERVLQYPLPALPTPTVVMVPRDADLLVYQQMERSYSLPRANDFIFSAEGFDFDHFLRIWIYLNKRILEIVSVKEVQAALRSFALQGFPDAHKLAKRLLKLFDSSNERKMMEQHWSKVWLDLKANRPEENIGVIALKTQALSNGRARASSDISGQLGSVTSTAHRNQTQKTYTMSKLQLELLRSENRFLSITISVPKPRDRAAFVTAELDAVFDARRCAGAGFIGAIWYWRELIVEFATCAQRDRALRTITRGSSTLVKENVQPIGSGEGGGPRLYMSWILPFYREDTPATLSRALDDHFDGTGYSSFFTFGQFDRPEGYIRIIFHNAPPALKSILKSHCFQERSFFIDVVTKSDYPLQKPSFMQKDIKAKADAGVAEELANHTDKGSMGLAVKSSDEEAAYPLQTELPFNGSESTVLPAAQGKNEVNADVDAAEGPRNDTGKRVEASPAEDSSIEILTPSHLGIASSGDNNAIEEQTQSSEKEIENDHRAVNKATTAVVANETTYFIPTALALSLQEATFNTFTRMYLEYGRDEPEKMDCKTLIKLYRTFLETQFPHVEGEARMDAFQLGGVAYPFTMAARNAYHKELFELSEAFRMRTSTSTSDSHSTDTYEIAQQTMSGYQDIEQDQVAPKKPSTTVVVDGTNHKVPTALALPLNEVTFNTFARTYMQIGSQEQTENLNSKNLLKLYRTFLNTQFPNIKGEPMNEALQRLNFEEAVINTRPGGLSYPFFIDSPYIYRKGLLVKAEKPQVTPAALSFAKHTTDDKALAQRSRAPSLDGGASCNTADKVTGSERKIFSSSQTSSLSSSSASIELAPSAPPQPKLQKPDMLSALERYLDDLDARLQLERELMATLHSKVVSQGNAEERDAG